MPGQNHQLSSAFRESVRLMVRLHYAMTTGDPDGPEAEAIRDAMESPWYAMTATEQELVGGLSEDLYTIGEERAVSGELAHVFDSELTSALTASGPEHTLEVLREHRLELPPEQVAALRGICWARLGQPDAAKPFFEEAARIAGQILIPS